MAVQLLGVCLAVLLTGAATAAKVNVNLTDKLVEQIKKKTFQPFVDELQKKDMDVNQPDSKGRLPLIEAVRVKELKFVDALLQYGSLAKSKDPATGATPLHVAFQQNLPQIAKMLLQYGADPNDKDKAGKMARDFAPSKEVRELILAYDADGPMAFEDAPGTWSKQSKGSSECRRPRIERPGEVPAEMMADIEGNVNVRWHNTKTDEFAWTDPAYHTPWRELTDEATGKTYWFNIESGESVWEMPSDMAWVQVKDEESGQHYYFNRITSDSTWDAPNHLSWVRHDTDL
ncbi:Zygote-specific protein 3 [Tetrabaena socialis]|uniref:Zygote-specific protein 3 n=1 Tax=Tetrabaena socialis TaxID=47790 RepID=A0A2J7ZN74_9CHLO|nr:Zygote-specific protein 3 [Tetrabaena socialis]|eukprot:PNH01707.1 Zygote-specific protein 3 [Tetrabaena socialis]